MCGGLSGASSGSLCPNDLFTLRMRQVRSYAVDAVGPLRPQMSTPADRLCFGGVVSLGGSGPGVRGAARSSIPAAGRSGGGNKRGNANVRTVLRTKNAPVTYATRIASDFRPGHGRAHGSGVEAAGEGGRSAIVESGASLTRTTDTVVRRLGSPRFLPRLPLPFAPRDPPLMVTVILASLESPPLLSSAAISGRMSWSGGSGERRGAIGPHVSNRADASPRWLRDPLPVPPSITVLFIAAPTRIE
jgi:hypothetical protein